MANAQLFPQSTYPLVGDISSTAGSPNVTVVGIQTTPVQAGAPQDQQSIVFQGTVSAYVPTFSPFNRSVQVNSVAMSDDYHCLVSNYDTFFQVNSSYSGNGKPILVNGV
jgi:hypothetical protein